MNQVKRQPLAAPLVLLLLGLLAGGVHTASSFGISILLAMAAFTLLSLILKCDHAFHPGLFGTLILSFLIVPPLAAAWSLSAVGAVGIYVAIVAVSVRLRRSSGWEGWNPPRGRNIGFSIAIGLVGSAAVMGWVWLDKPDLSEQAASIPEASLPVLVLLGLAFARSILSRRKPSSAAFS